MKTQNISVLFRAFLLCAPVHGQNNFVYDQESADDNHILEGGTGISDSWTDLLVTNITGTGQDVSLTDTNATPAIKRFYRLKLVP